MISVIYRYVFRQQLNAKRIVENKVQDKITEIASNKVNLPFRGSFPPGKFSEKELKKLDKAGVEIENWNQAVLKLRKEAKE
jgi:hypothetical protein